MRDSLGLLVSASFCETMFNLLLTFDHDCSQTRSNNSTNTGTIFKLLATCMSAYEKDVSSHNFYCIIAGAPVHEYNYFHRNVVWLKPDWLLHHCSAVCCAHQARLFARNFLLIRSFSLAGCVSSCSSAPASFCYLGRLLS